MDIAAILFNGAKPFEQIVYILLTESPISLKGKKDLVKIGQAVLEKTFKKLHYSIHVHSPEARAYNARGTKF